MNEEIRKHLKERLDYALLSISSELSLAVFNEQEKKKSHLLKLAEFRVCLVNCGFSLDEAKLFVFKKGY